LESELGQSGSTAPAPEFSLSRQLAATHSSQPFSQHVDPHFLSPLLLHYGEDTPYIPVNLDGNLLPFLLDTCAAVSVLPKAKLVPLLSKPLSAYETSETVESRSITAFGGHLVTVAGPYVFPIEVLTQKLCYKFYVIDSPAPFIAGFDLVVAAQLIIDAVGRTVYTRSPSTNSFAYRVTLHSSVPGDEPLRPLLFPSRPHSSRRRLLHPPGRARACGSASMSHRRSSHLAHRRALSVSSVRPA